MSKYEIERMLDREAGQYIRRIDDRKAQKAFKELVEGIAKAIEQNNAEIANYLDSHFAER